nr:PIN domain-containing protein [Maritimibacter sp. DP1N21-5]
MIDACVLYPTVMREVVLGAARAGIFQPLWSERILEEWARAAAKLGPGQEALARAEVAALVAAFPRASVQVRAGDMARLWLPDPNDVHVLAAAIAGSADVLLTMNVKDFPRSTVAEEGLRLAVPDLFVMECWAANEAAMIAVGRAILVEAVRLSGENWSARRLMKKARLPRYGKALEAAGVE